MLNLMNSKNVWTTFFWRHVKFHNGMTRSRPVHDTMIQHDAMLKVSAVLAAPRRRMDPRAAVLTGKLSIRGDMALAARLRDWMYTVIARRAAAGDELQVVARDRWEKDHEAAGCAVCRQPFSKVCVSCVSCFVCVYVL